MNISASAVEHKCISHRTYVHSSCHSAWQHEDIHSSLLPRITRNKKQKRLQSFTPCNLHYSFHFHLLFTYIQKNPNLLSTCHVFPDTHIVVLHFQKTCYKNFFHPFKHTSYPVFMFYDTKIQVLWHTLSCFTTHIYTNQPNS